MVRTVNPQIGSVLNRETGAIPGSFQNHFPFDGPRSQALRNTQAVSTESISATRGNLSTEPSRPSHSSSSVDWSPDSAKQPSHGEQIPGTTSTSEDQDGAPEADSIGPATPSTTLLTGIDACIDRLIRNPILRPHTQNQADTLIFIDRVCLQNRDLEDQLQEYYSNRPILVERCKLEALNSPYFTKCFSGMYQTRKWKFLSAKVALYTLPPGIKYIINMTPVNEGPEAVEAIQDLSCPFGVLHWKKSCERWSNSKSLVGGIDENDIDIDHKPYTVAMEYSLVRHIKSIERFMTALQGLDPQLDTAPKVYSAVMVSKAWGIQGQHPLTDYVVRWLCDSEANSKFIEAYPEVVLKMADVLKCGPLCKDAFAVLVGEAALEATVTGTVDDEETVYERTKGDIEEDWLSRVQHARNSFADRTKEAFDALAGQDMEWVSSLSPVRNIQLKAELSMDEYPKEVPQFNKFLALLKRFIRGAIYSFLCNDYLPMRHPAEQISSEGDNLYPRDIENTVWNKLRAPERVFTKRFWQVVYGCYLDLFREVLSSNWSMIKSCRPSRGLSPICTEYAGGQLLQTFSLLDLIKALPASSQVWKSASSASTRSVPIKVATTGPVSVPFRQHTGNVVENGNCWTTITSEQEESVNALRAGLISDWDASYPNCERSGCSRRYYTTSLLSVCKRCGSQFCADHVKSVKHDCQPPRPKLAPVLSQDPLDAASLQSTYRDTHSTDEESDSETTSSKQEQLALPLIENILQSAVRHISAVGRNMLFNAPGGNLGSVDDACRITHTLACLSYDELKYLPLWAEGLDDGTGGVFGEHIPEASEDSAGLGPGGRRLASRSEGSNYSFVSETVDSTVNTSTIAHDGYRDTLPRRQVVAMDDIESSSEGGWSYIQDTIGEGKGKARAFPPKQGSETASTLGGLEKASVIDSGTQSGTDSFDHMDSDIDVKSIGSSDGSSPRTVGEAENYDDEMSDDHEGANDDFDPEYADSDDDVDMMFDDGLVQMELTERASTMAQKSGLDIPGPNTPTTILQEHNPTAHVSYLYKDGDNSDDLMTRL